MMNELSTAIENANQNSELNCVVLSANGPVFSAGHNLKELVKSVDIFWRLRYLLYSL